MAALAWHKWLIALFAAVLLISGPELIHGRALVAGTRVAPVAEAAVEAPVTRTGPVEGPAAGALAEEEPLAGDIEMALFELTNDDRSLNGVAPVVFDPCLLEVARARAAAQVAGAPLSHNDAAGKLAIVGLLTDAGIDYRLAGENLARLTDPNSSAAQRAQEALMRSPGHRRNILEPRFNRLAVGAATDAAGRLVYAQIFRAIDE